MRHTSAHAPWRIMLVAMSAVASAPASPGRPAHLVLAVAWGYQPEVYKVFLSSLRNTGYRGDIKILAPEGGTLPAAAEVCARHGAEIVGLFNMTLHPTGHPKAGKPAWMSGERFNMYDALCGGGGYEWCLAADFRDVFFQSNPFANLPQHSGSFHEVERPHANRKKGGVQQAPTPELLLPLESRVIGTCPHNSYMMRRCFGKPAVAAIGANPVICSGVIMGTPAAYAVLRRIATLVRRCPFDKMSDQVSLNYAIYHSAVAPLRHADGRPLRIETQPRGTGYTNTIGVYKGPSKVAELQRQHMRDGVVLNDDGTPSSIVHQYDRVMMSTSPTGRYGKTAELLRLRVVDDAVGVRPNSSWLGVGA